MTLFCLIVMLIPVFSYSGNAKPVNKLAAADGEANVTLEWNTSSGSGTAVDAGGIAYSTNLGKETAKQTVKAKLTLHNPQKDVDVKVRVVTHDVSARERYNSIGDYDAIDNTYTLNSDMTTAEIAISVYPQYNYRKDSLDLSIRKGNAQVITTKVFGLRIHSVENAVANHNKNSLLAQVLCDTSQILDTWTNETFVYYLGEFNEGYSYLATGLEYSQSISDFSSKKVNGKKTTQTTLLNPTTWIPTDQLTVLRNFYSEELAYYYRVNGYVKTDCDLPTGTTFKIWNDNGTLYEDDWAEPKDDGVGSHYEFPREGDGTSKGISHNSRDVANNATKYLKYDGKDVTFWFKNRSCTPRTLHDWYYQMIIDSNTKPTVTGYRMDTGAYGYGDELYLAVDFSKEVQVKVPSGSTFQVRGYIGGSEVLFDYAGGSQTSTLYFKKSLDAVEYNGTSVSIVSFEGANVEVSDMFMNGNNMNNTLELAELPRASRYNPLATFNTTVDTRSPDVETSYTSKYTKKSHVVPIELSSITDAATMDVCWSESQDAASITNWTPVNISGNGTVNVTGSNFTGTRYLHVRVTSATGKRTIKTLGPYEFDNNDPKIKNISVTDNNIYQKQHAVSVTIENLEEAAQTYLNKVYLYVKDTSGSTIVDKKLVYDRDSSSNLLTAGEGNVYNMNVDTVLLGISADTYGDYRIGFMAEDTLGNTQTEPVYANKATAFDNRDTFEAIVQKDASEKDFIFDDQEIIVMSGESRTVSLIAEGTQYASLSVKSIAKNGTLIYDDTKGAYGASPSEEAKLDGYDASNVSGWTVTSSDSKFTAAVTFAQDAEGYYDVIVIANKQRQSQVIRFFLTKEAEQSNPDNYKALYAEDRLLINEVWRFTTNYFYKYGTDPEKYVNVTPDKNPIFSSKDKALEYAKFKEYQDLTPIVLEASQAQQLEAGTNSAFMKAGVPENENVTAQAGQIWIRYKSTNWKVGSTSSNSTSSWVYYYYGDGSGVETGTTPIISDVKKLPSYLEEAVIINAKKICGYDGEPYYLTYNNGHQTTGRTLTYEKEAIFFDPLTYTDGFAIPVEYSGDPDIYDNTVNVDVNGKAQDLPYFSEHDVYFEGGYGALYYRLLGAEAWSVAYNGDQLQSFFKTTGVYEFVEMGNGYKQYYLYVDKSEPILFYDFTHQNSEESTVSYLDKNIEGSVFNAKSVTLKGILYGSNSVPGYTSEVDEYAYVCVMNSNSTVLLKFLTMKQLHEMENGYPLTSGTYQIYAYDRLGNSTYMTVRVNDETLSVVEQIRENNSITFHFNRRLTEIREETFEIYRDGVKLDVAYAEAITFKESGLYRVKLTDIYGYSIDQTFEFTRDYPELRFYYTENGRYHEVPVVDETAEDSEDATVSTDQAVKVIKQTDNSYLVICAEDIRITYSNETDYIVRTVSGNPTVKQGGLNSVTLDISGGTEDWGIQIAYEDDPLVYVSVICSYDVDAPVISAYGETTKYVYNDTNGGNNVLFQEDGTRTVVVENGSRLNTTSITMNWSDENELRKVYYVRQGEDSQVVELEDPNAGTCVIEGAGRYTFYAVDLIGNTAEFSFTLAETLNLTYMIGDKEIPFRPNPLDYIDGDVYTETQYTGEAVRFMFNNYGTAVVLWSNGVEAYIYYIIYSEDGIFIVYLQDGEEILVNTTTELITSGTLMEEPFRLCHGSTSDGRYLEIPAPQTAYEFWQFRISDAMGVSPVITQFVQSNALPEVELVEEDGEAVPQNTSDFVGVNSAVSIVGESVSDEIQSVVAYRNEKYSMDFTNAQAYVMYDGTGYASISEHGYYKIVATNIYGNEQVTYLRLSFALDINVLVEYADGEQRTYTLGTEKAQGFKSNSLVGFSVWDMECKISVKKNDIAFLPKFEQRIGHFYFELSAYGEYEITALDSCGNLYKISVSLQEPKEIPYQDYLTDFNEEALYKDKFYSNAPVSLDRAAVENGAIGCVTYVYVDGNGKKYPAVTLYDVISQEPIEYSEENFLRSIGKEGDGVYEVTFTDAYGNKCKETVSISTAAQLFISRTTQNGSRADAWTLQDALDIGVWSNRLVTLTDKAKASLLTVDGKKAEFVDGKYVLEYPSMTTTEDVQRQVVYVDEYGNKYSFTVHLYRKTPEVTLESEKQLIVIGGEAYLQGSFAYAWTDTKVTATYAVDMSDAKPYVSGTVFTEDAYYAFIFTDIAGNEATRTVTIDTKVSYSLRNGGITVLSGITANGTVSLYEEGESLTVESVEKDGKVLKTKDRSFNEHGIYKLVIKDVLGNRTSLEFTIYNHAMNSFSYTANENYSITQVWYHREEGLQSYVGDVVMDETQTRHVYAFKLEGQYEIDLYHQATGETFSFTVFIDDTAPTAALVGVEQKGTTRKNVTLEGLQAGDVVKIYNGKKLEQTFKVEADGQSPTIKEAGKYRVVITDEAGNTTEYRFTREFTTNTASNLLIILLLSLTVAGGFIYIVLRDKNKIK